jgi:3-deoxy-D-manno-octulosonate 8-phosphate phosphatase (KDO 8-P phosphatase)
MSDFAARLAGIRLLSLDLDGVLTDGGLYYTEAGDVMRKYDVKDGMGIELLMQAGLPVSVITASDTPAIATRLARLRIPHVRMGIRHKLPELQAICAGLGIGLDQVLHLADDVNDLPVLDVVGLPVAVADALPAVKAVARHTTARPGGRGAVREICDALIAARGA